FKQQFQYFVITVQDRPATNLIQYFNDTFTFIEDCISQGGNVLVHCMAGISRSATIVIAYLMRKHQWTTLAAMETVRSSRKIIR
ncbi:dual specificity phosphatase, partial [Syncephalis fuscata]